MKSRHDAEREWAVELPPSMDSFVQDARDSCRLVGGQIVSLPFPPLTFEAIANAKDVAEDWDIPEGLVPIMGDFHDLVCLDYRRSSQPAVILIDDSRSEKALFDSFDGFMSALCVATETNTETVEIIKGESWLHF